LPQDNEGHTGKLARGICIYTSDRNYLLGEKVGEKHCEHRGKARAAIGLPEQGKTQASRVAQFFLIQ
jgi:hypothetical protein